MTGQDQLHDGRRPRGPRSLRWLTADGALHLPVQRSPRLEERVVKDAEDAFSAEEPAQTATRPTRKLCALAYIDEELRADIDEHFPVWRRRAWAPCYSIDLMPLLYHGRRSARLALLRDVLLSLILLGVMAVLWHVAFGLKPLGLLAVGGTAAVVAITRLILVRREVSVRSAGSKLWRFAKSEWQQFFARTVVVAAIVAMALGWTVTHREGRLSLAVLAAGLACAWLVTTTFSAIAYAMACHVAATTDFTGLEAKLPAALWQRAREATTGNILIYTNGRARGPLGPFVGAGHRLAHWTTPSVDVNKRRDSKIAPKQVDLIDLHHRLHAAVSDLGIPTLQCEHRLYVDSAAMSAASTLMDPATGRPRTWIPEAAVLERLGRWGKFHRSYLCLQASSPDGDIVVTMFVHAMLEKDLLQLEIGIHALPEVSWPKTEPDRRDGDVVTPRRRDGKGSKPVRNPHVPPTIFLAVLTGIAMGTRTYGPILLGALRRTFVTLVDPLVQQAVSINDRRMIAHRRFEFGTEMSLRERLAMNQRMHHNLFVDMMAQAERLQRRLTDAVAEYLKSLGIDPGDFAQQTLTIFNNIQQTIISTLNTGAAAFGQGSTATGTMHAAPATPAAPAGGAGTPRQQGPS